MAQFDVYKRAGTGGLLLDCQSDLLAGLPTRFLVPLLPDSSEPISPRLNPKFVVDGDQYMLAPQLALSAPLDRIGQKVGSLADEHSGIVRALDILLGGV